jgi:hypothetical protein
MEKKEMESYLRQHGPLISIMDITDNGLKKVKSVKYLTYFVNIPLLGFASAFLYVVQKLDYPQGKKNALSFVLTVADLFFLLATYISMSMFSNIVTQIKYDTTNAQFIFTYSTFLLSNEVEKIPPNDMAHFQPTFIKSLAHYQRQSNKKAFITQMSPKWHNKMLFDSLIEHNKNQSKTNK